VANTVVSGKSEVSVEFNLPPKDLKERRNDDTLVEIKCLFFNPRFYIPGTVTEGQIEEDGETRVFKDINEAALLEEPDSDGEAGEITADSQKVSFAA
jgi:hypothetical protein